MVNYLIIISLFLSTMLAYTQSDDGFMSNVGKYVPERIKTWYQQRQEEQQRASKAENERKKNS